MTVIMVARYLYHQNQMKLQSRPGALILIAVCSSATLLLSLKIPALPFESTTDPSGTAQTPAPNDPQIAAIIVAADHAVIQAGLLARAKSQNQELLQFAAKIVDYHQKCCRQTGLLMDKLNLYPEESAQSQDLLQTGETNVEILKRLSGSGFDRTFLEQIIASERQLLVTLDAGLIPNARNAELKSFLIRKRGDISNHLALILKVSLKGTKS